MISQEAGVLLARIRLLQLQDVRMAGTEASEKRMLFTGYWDKYNNLVILKRLPMRLRLFLHRHFWMQRTQWRGDTYACPGNVRMF